MGYRLGHFPMGEPDGTLAWYTSIRRAIFPLTGIHRSRSSLRTQRRRGYRTTFDLCFEDVMRGCLRAQDNWINEELIEVFCAAHREGWAHSAECWEGDRLVGGVYGVAIGRLFAAESMFHRETDASKVALGALVDRCRELGFVLFDAQVITPNLASLGALEASPAEYMSLLTEALKGTTPWSNQGTR